MTNMPEAKLAREAEICYATVAMVTDYDCWHEDHDDVSIEGVLQIVRENAATARELVRALAPAVAGRRRPCAAGCHRALENAIITAPEARNQYLVQRLDAVAGRVLQR